MRGNRLKWILLYFRACDNCEEWYHGDCIGVTEKDAGFIKQYYCDPCKGNTNIVGLLSSLCHNPHTERREWKSSANPRTYDFNKTKINFGMEKNDHLYNFVPLIS